MTPSHRSNPVNATADRPTAAELNQLSELLGATPLDRPALITRLGEIEQGLCERAGDLDRSGGLLDESDKAHRMSLAREDDRLRDEAGGLLRELAELRQAAAGATSDEELRVRGSALLAGLQGHHDAESSLVLESADTEVGAGD
jgi:hypothetical protein